MGSKVRMAIIGAGIWGENHAIAFTDDPGVELVCVCDLQAEKAKALAEKYNCDYTTDMHEAVRGDVDAVSIATPDFAHTAPALAAIEAGKHVLVEKPFTTDVREGKAIIEAAERSGVKLMVDFHTRWNPRYLGAKGAVERGDLGAPLMGYSRLSDTIYVPTQMLSWSAASGPEWFLFPHTMDAVRWVLAEEPREIYARAQRGVLADRGIDAYDSIQALVTFEKSFITFETSWILPESFPSVVDSAFSLVGPGGSLQTPNDFPFALAGERYHVPFASHSVNRYGKPAGFQYESIKYFADCVARDVTPEPSGYDGLVATAMIIATLKSIEEGRPVQISEVL